MATEGWIFFRLHRATAMIICLHICNVLETICDTKVLDGSYSEKNVKNPRIPESPLTVMDSIIPLSQDWNF